MALIHSCDSSEGPLQPCKQKSERQTDREREGGDIVSILYFKQYF